MPTTYHLARAHEWRSHADQTTYVPSTFAHEGFIHCTDGADEMVITANRHYRADPDHFIVLEIDLGRVEGRVVYEDDRRIYPHIYGPIPRAAVVTELEAIRAEDGTFLGLGEVTRP